MYQMTAKYTKWPKNIPNGCKIYQTYTNNFYSKNLQIGIFGMQIQHLATLIKPWRRFIVVSSPPATEATGVTGREIESRKGLGW
jgi:hypothetical protein